MTIAELKKLLEDYPDDLDIVILRPTNQYGGGTIEVIDKLRPCINQDTNKQFVMITPL